MLVKFRISKEQVEKLVIIVVISEDAKISWIKLVAEIVPYSIQLFSKYNLKKSIVFKVCV